MTSSTHKAPLLNPVEAGESYSKDKDTSPADVQHVSIEPLQIESAGANEPSEAAAALNPGDTGTGSFVHPMSLAKRRYMVGVFTVIAALIFSDQNLLAPHLTQAAEDFGFDDTQKDQYLGGYIMAAFFMVGAPAAILVGWLTDKTNRRNLLFVVVLIGAVPSLATFWVRHYWELLLLRTLTGVSVGGCFPLVYSLLGDLFPISQRSAVSAFVLIATGAGIIGGQAISSLTGGTNWRIPFVIVAVPSILAALIMLLTTQEPPRGAFEEALKGHYADGDEYKESITWPKVRLLLRVPSNWLIIMQGLPGSLPWGMILTYFNDYLSHDKGFSIQVATLVVLLFGLGGAVGVVGGGWLGQHLYNRNKEYMALLMGASVIAGMGPVIYLVNAPLIDLSLGGTCLMSLLGGIQASVAGPNVRAVLMNVNEPETRGVAFALQTTTDDLGKGLGPFIVAWFITYLGRRNAFNVAIAGWVPCAILLFSLVFCLRKDEAAMQARLKRYVEAASGNQLARDRTSTADLDTDARNGSKVDVHIPPSMTAASEAQPLVVTQGSTQNLEVLGSIPLPGAVVTNQSLTGPARSSQTREQELSRLITQNSSHEASDPSSCSTPLGSAQRSKSNHALTGQTSEPSTVMVTPGGQVTLGQPPGRPS